MQSLDDVTGYVSKCVGEWLMEAERQGFRTPLHCATVARNGAMMFNRYDDDGTGTFESEVLTYVGSEFDFPIHIMLTDSTGKCTHIGFEGRERQ